MNVVFISTDRNICNPKSGVAKRIKEYANHCNRVAVVLLAKKSDGVEACSLGRNVTVFPTQSLFRVTSVLEAFFVTRHRVHLFGSDQPVVVSSQDPFETGLVGFVVSVITRAYFHAQVHTDCFSPYFGRDSFLNKVRRFVAPFILRRAQAVRVVSERIKKTLVIRGVESTRIAVLPIAVEPSCFVDREPDFDIHKQFSDFSSIILVASRLTQEKRLTDAIDVVARLPKNLKAGLVVVGDGPEKERLQRYARIQGVENRIKFVGWSDNLVSYYKTADVFLLTSAFEGYGRTLVEAALCKIPIVTTDVGVVGSVFEAQYDLSVCPVGDLTCLASSVERIFSGQGDSVRVDHAFTMAKRHVEQNKNSHAISENLGQAVQG